MATSRGLTVITAYGKPSDKEKLKALAAQEGIPESKWVVYQIRAEYEKKCGESS